MNIGIKDFLSWYSVNNFLQFDVLHIKNRKLSLGDIPILLRGPPNRNILSL